MFGFLRRSSGPAAPAPSDVDGQVTRALRRAIPQRAVGITDDPAPIRAALDVLQRTQRALANLQTLIGQMGEVATSAMATYDTGERAILAERYEDLRAEMSARFASDELGLASTGAAPVEVPMPGNAAYVIAPISFHPDAAGSALPLPRTAFAETTEIHAILDAIDSALAHLDRAFQTCEGDRRYVTRRLAASQETEPA